MNVLAQSCIRRALSNLVVKLALDRFFMVAEEALEISGYFWLFFFQLFLSCLASSCLKS